MPSFTALSATVVSNSHLRHHNQLPLPKPRNPTGHPRLNALKDRSGSGISRGFFKDHLVRKTAPKTTLPLSSGRKSSGISVPLRRVISTAAVQMFPSRLTRRGRVDRVLSSNVQRRSISALMFPGMRLLNSQPIKRYPFRSSWKMAIPSGRRSPQDPWTGVFPCWSCLPREFKIAVIHITRDHRISRDPFGK